MLANSSRNGRVYDTEVMFNAIKKWTAHFSAEFDSTIKDVNAFYRDKKTAKNTDRLERFIMDPQSIFIDYIGLLRP